MGRFFKVLSGYIVVGSKDGDFWLIKVDSNGTEQWNKTFSRTDWDKAYSVQQTSDGGYIIAGSSPTAGNNNFWLIKTDSDGNKEWDRTFGSTISVAYAVQQTTDGGYILTGSTWSRHVDSHWHTDHVWLVKTNSNGYEEWNKIFSGTCTDLAFSVQETTDGGYILAGVTCFFDAWLIKLSPEGSTTDTTPPELNITSPADGTTTRSPTITIAGTASDTSGIASVTVNGEPANGTGNWSANVTLSEGENLITVIASDGEGLNTTAAVTVCYEPLEGDLNSNGILDSADAAIALEIAVGNRQFDDAADVSGNSRVSSLDALMILQAAAGR